MNKPPVTLFYPSYVIEFAIVDSSITFVDRKTLNVGGEWLGKVPKLAISKDIETSEYRLSHCDDDWNDLCSVQTSTSIDLIKQIAEKHYQGITKNWIPTNYKQSDAEVLFLEEADKYRCSFCKKSYYDNAFTTIIGEDPKICDVCVKKFYEIINEKDS
jgi:hypothetical protein